jgi:hypothetical protein
VEKAGLSTRAELANVIRQLRQSRTRLAPLEVAERVQHAIVRLEQLMVADPLPENLEAALADAHDLVAYCAALVAKP